MSQIFSFKWFWQLLTGFLFRFYAVPATAAAFPDVLDIRFQRIWSDWYPQLDDMIPELYTVTPHNGRDVMTFSQVGAFADIPEFTGSVDYQSPSQGYDTTITYVQYASGFQIERQLYDDDQYHIMDQRPSGLATAAQRTRQGHAASIFTGAFSASSDFYVNSENVALASDSHTTETGASTATGFDNLITDAFSATALASARIQARGFRDDQGGRMDINMDEIWYPPDLYEEVFEVVKSMGKVDSAENNRNVHYGAYTMKEWNYLADANNWFLADSRLRKMMVIWVDRIPDEFAFAEDLDTIVGKWRLYSRIGLGTWDWRWCLGANVS